MNHCTKCGAKLKGNETFCTNCGKKQIKSKEDKKTSKGVKIKEKQKSIDLPKSENKIIKTFFIIFLSLIIIWAVIASINWFNLDATNDKLNIDLNTCNSQFSQEKSKNADLKNQISQVRNKLDSTERNLETTKSELSDKKAEIKLLQEKISTYESQLDDLNTELQQSKQGLTTCINDVYYTQSYDFVRSHETGFKLLCAKPCSLSQEKLDEIYFQMAHSMIEFEKNLRVDLFKFFKSVEVHAEPDKVCNKEVQACAYASVLGQTPELRRGFICNIVKGCESSNEVYLHEMAHMLWKNQDIPISFNEGFSKVSSKIIDGSQKSFCDKEFHIESSILFGLIKQTKTVTPYTKGEEIFYQLCKKHGFDFNNLLLFFQKASEYPNYYTSGLKFNDFVNIISSIVGEDVSQTVNEVMSISIEGTECGNNKCESDERFSCVSDCS